MAFNKTKPVKNLNRFDFPFVILSLFFIALAGLFFLSAKDLRGANIYISLSFSFVSIIYVLTLFIKNDNKLLGGYFPLPISRSRPLTIFLLVLGGLSFFFFRIIFKIFSPSFNVASLSIPFTATSVGAGQTFSIAFLEQSLPIQLFITSYTASVIETLAYSIGGVLMGAVIGITIFNLLSKEEKSNKISLSKLWFVRLFALGFGTFAFIGSHFLNGTYEGGMYVFAGLFFLISTISMYMLGFYVAYHIGYHFVNNIFVVILVYGFKEVFIGSGWFGALLSVTIGLLFFYLIRNWNNVKADASTWFFETFERFVEFFGFN